MTLPENFHIINHPVIEHKLTQIRNEKTQPKEIRELVKEVSVLLGYESAKKLPVKSVKIKTPLIQTHSGKIPMGNIIIVPILRAGLGMVGGLLSLFPKAKVGHVGMERNHVSYLPSEYYFKIPPNSEDHFFFVIDPMLATGGTVTATVQKLKDSGAKDIRFLCLIAATEGVNAFCNAHPDVEVFAGALDERLNGDKYIVPGLGDAGDRLYGTE